MHGLIYIDRQVNRQLMNKQTVRNTNNKAYMRAQSIKHNTVEQVKFSYRGCTPRSPGHLSQQFYKLRSYYDDISKSISK